MGPLERWALGDRLLEARQRRGDLDRALMAERGRGLLPPGPLGDSALSEVRGVVEALVAEAEGLACGSAEAVPVEVNVALPGGRTLVGTVPSVRDGVVLRCTYSKLGPKHRLRAWALFLTLSAYRPELAPSAVTIGQAAGSSTRRPRISVCTLEPLAESPAAIRSESIKLLEGLVDLYLRGMREPLPISCATSETWAAARLRDEDPRGPARGLWTSSSEEFPGEEAEPEHITVFGTALPFEQLLGWPPADDETGKGWDTTEPSRFGRLAMRLWRPLLGHERLKER